MFDILIRNGRIVDGVGNPWFPGDVGIEGDRITAIGNIGPAEAKVTIDAGGKIICPGFVDCHAHSDKSILVNREATSSILQGVTTEIGGNCGFVSFFTPDIPVDWARFVAWLDDLSTGTAINYGQQVGHHTIRRAVMGMDDRKPTEDEMQQMGCLVAEALDAGAIGLSFGLEFMPGRVADQEELRRLCALAAERNKVTSWHVRNRDRRFEEAVVEAIEVTRTAGASLQLSHLSAKPGSSPRSWNRVMEQVCLAREQGLDVQCDMIPYVAGPGKMSTILPTWATRGAVPDIQARLRDPKTRELLMAESDRYWLLFYYREWDKLTLTSSCSHPDWVGLTFREIGDATGKDPFDCVYDILADEGDMMDATKVNGVLFSEGDIIEWLSDPLFSIASDGFTATDNGPLTSVANHPNCYGWTPTVIQKYVRELRALRLEEAIRKMTSMPAARFGLTQRGILREGMMADVIVFDDAKFQTRSTYLKPHVYAEGMDFVIVNGQLALEDGTPTGRLAGRVLRD